MYLVLITNKGSNIIEDLDTLRLVGKVRGGAGARGAARARASAARLSHAHAPAPLPRAPRRSFPRRTWAWP